MGDGFARCALIGRQGDGLIGERVRVAARKLHGVTAVLDDPVSAAVRQAPERCLTGLDLIGDALARHESVRLDDVAAVIGSQIDIVGACVVAADLMAAIDIDIDAFAAEGRRCGARYR